MLAHAGPCTTAESLSTVGIGGIVGLLLFGPWKRRHWGAWVVPIVLVSAVTVGACGGKSPSSGPRPTTQARLEIVKPTPDQVMPPNFTLEMNLVGAKVVPANVTGGPLRGTEGHIHVSLDGKLITMAYGTSQDLNNIAPGPHNIQAEFVATDHASFANRVIVAVAFSVAAEGAAP